MSCRKPYEQTKIPSRPKIGVATDVSVGWVVLMGRAGDSWQLMAGFETNRIFSCESRRGYHFSREAFFP